MYCLTHVIGQVYSKFMLVTGGFDQAELIKLNNWYLCNIAIGHHDRLDLLIKCNGVCGVPVLRYTNTGFGWSHGCRSKRAQGKKGQDMHQKHDLNMDTMIASTREWIPVYTGFRTGSMNKSNKYYTGRQGERERKEVAGSEWSGRSGSSARAFSCARTTYPRSWLGRGSG